MADLLRGIRPTDLPVCSRTPVITKYATYDDGARIEKSEIVKAAPVKDDQHDGSWRKVADRTEKEERPLVKNSHVELLKIL